MNVNRVMIIGASLIILALVVWWAIVSVEIVEIEKILPPSPEARKDPWLAIARSLQPEPGVVRYEYVDEIDFKQAGVIAINAFRLQTFEEGELEDWVSKGGRLILIFEPDEEDELPGLPKHELYRQLTPELSESFYESSGQMLTAKNESHKSLPQSITLDTSLDFSEVYPDESTSVYYEGGEKKAVVRAYGKGELFATGIPLALYNEALKAQPNRELAAFLFELPARQGLKAWLPKSIFEDSQEVKRLDMSPVLLSFALVFIMLFWMGGPRLGSVIQDEVQERRSLRERFRAEGLFLWQNNARSLMLGDASDAGRLSKRAFVEAVNEIIRADQKQRKI